MSIRVVYSGAMVFYAMILLLAVLAVTELRTPVRATVGVVVS